LTVKPSTVVPVDLVVGTPTSAANDSMKDWACLQNCGTQLVEELCGSLCLHWSGLIRRLVTVLFAVWWWGLWYHDFVN
jgi:hypothetical protein